MFGHGSKNDKTYLINNRCLTLHSIYWIFVLGVGLYVYIYTPNWFCNPEPPYSYIYAYNIPIDRYVYIYIYLLKEYHIYMYLILWNMSILAASNFSQDLPHSLDSDGTDRSWSKVFFLLHTRILESHLDMEYVENQFPQCQFSTVSFRKCRHWCLSIFTVAVFAHKLSSSTKLCFLRIIVHVHTHTQFVHVLKKDMPKNVKGDPCSWMEQQARTFISKHQLSKVIQSKTTSIGESPAFHKILGYWSIGLCKTMYTVYCILLFRQRTHSLPHG